MAGPATKPDDSAVPPGQRVVEGFPRFGTHLNLRAPEIPSEPTLEIRGEVREPVTVSLSLLAELPRRRQRSDFHCVSGWSAVGLEWEGVSFAGFYDLHVRPALRPGSQPSYVILRGLDGYEAMALLEDVLADSVLLADRLNGALLSADHGAPLRLVSPDQYGFVSTKHLASVEVCSGEPKARYTSVHPLGKLLLRGPLFQRHPRARVWQEERHRWMAPHAARAIYARIRGPIAWMSARGAQHEPGPGPEGPDLSD